MKNFALMVLLISSSALAAPERRDCPTGTGIFLECTTTDVDWGSPILRDMIEGLRFCARLTRSGKAKDLQVSVSLNGEAPTDYTPATMSVRVGATVYEADEGALHLSVKRRGPARLSMDMGGGPVDTGMICKRP